MILTQHYLSCLSQASYLVGDETTGRAVVVDPRRDVGVYLEEAETRGLVIERVINTHVHADFLAGHLELADRTGAVISFGEGAQVDFPIDELRDGQRLCLGEVTLVVAATPGHTPESICILVFEQADDEEPAAVLTGDTLFVGDVGRPDLLASSGAEFSADALARRLYRSLREKLLVLPDRTRVLPAHGAGSMCGKALSSQTMSTIGEQRRTNYALQEMSEDEFVLAVTQGQPVRPAYFPFSARANRRRHDLLDEGSPQLLGLDEVLALQALGAVLLDQREPTEFALGHLRGALNVGLLGRFADWAGQIVPFEAEVVLVGDPVSAAEARIRLSRIGLDRVVGALRDPDSALAARPDLVETSSRLEVGQLAAMIDAKENYVLLDVRLPSETAVGRLPGAVEIPLAALGGSLEALDPTRPLVVYCGTGYRSQTAASFLAFHGHVGVADLVGGYAAWVAAGLPTNDHRSGESRPVGSLLATT